MCLALCGGEIRNSKLEFYSVKFGLVKWGCYNIKFDSCYSGEFDIDFALYGGVLNMELGMLYYILENLLALRCNTISLLLFCKRNVYFEKGMKSSLNLTIDSDRSFAV
jgi:hypothetical protein